MRATLHRLASTRTGIPALVVLALVCLAALVSLVWTPQDPAAIHLAQSWQGPSAAHLLGTDRLGRDTASRILAGARTTVVIAVGSGVLASVVGLALGALGGLATRRVREPVAVLIDILIAFPTLLIAMTLVAVAGSGTWVVILAVGIGAGVAIARVSRGEMRRVATSDFVAAARSSDLSAGQVLRRHILPNIAPVYVVQVSYACASALLAEAGLSYLGLGVPPETVSWGTMLSNGQDYIAVAPFSVLWSGLAISLTVLAITLAGDAIRDTLDPRLAREVPQNAQENASRERIVAPRGTSEGAS